jgi:hypothetical protein
MTALKAEEMLVNVAIGEVPAEPVLPPGAESSQIISREA